MGRKVTALDVAKFFFAACDEDSGDLISNMKMQKLVYYAQGVHLAMTGERLFDEDIMAWLHGPVVRSLYNELKKFGSGAVELDLKGFDFKIFTPKQREILEDVYNVFGQFSAWALSGKTHNEPPYQIAAKNGVSAGDNSVISDESMRDYFKTQLT
ncbi:MAG: DUF4065 domain-containing protein [Helicobacteraceae bacterium]|jgi:uncharacterized phage-associated protein|nr:DUF4065 domain-containing protein [Helicobacteraceae bacterium]